MYECVTDPQYSQVTFVCRMTRSRRHAYFSSKKLKVRLIVVDSTNGLTISKILTIKVASNFQNDIKSSRIVYQIKIPEI